MLRHAAWEPVPGAPPVTATALTVDKRGYVYWAADGCIFECGSVNFNNQPILEDAGVKVFSMVLLAD